MRHYEKIMELEEKMNSEFARRNVLLKKKDDIKQL